VPIIAMTASVQVADRERCLAAGMDDYLGKPLDPGRLTQALDRWIGPTADDATLADRSGGHADLDPASVLDVERLRGLAGVRTSDGETLVDRMIGYFNASGPNHLQRLRDAAADGDLATVAQVAHKLTGESATVGAVAVGRIAHEIELLARSGTGPEENDSIRQLEQAVSAAINALRQFQTAVRVSSVV
jgi:HPt (histidine-containing phosphotransfer) domain-containing protein